MIVNTFTFNGQYQMLDVHLSYMYDYVDKFLIVQANRTFSGHQKCVQNYYSKCHQHFDLARFQDKIVWHSFDAAQYMHKHKLIPQKFLRYRDVTSWYIQNTTKTQWIQYAVSLQQCVSQEIIFIISDLDEIPNMANINVITDMFNSGQCIVGLDGCPLYKSKFNILCSNRAGVFLKFCNVTNMLAQDKLVIRDWWLNFNQYQHSIGAVKNMPTVIDGRKMAWHFTNVMSTSQAVRKYNDLSHIIDFKTEDQRPLQTQVEEILTHKNTPHKVIPIDKLNFPQQMIAVIKKYPYLIQE